MKYIVLAVFTTLLFSCKKNYTCECTFNDKMEIQTLSKIKKNDAKAICEKWNELYAKAGEKCTLK